MAAAKLLNLIAVSTLAILAASFGATPVSAVSVDVSHLGARSHAHAALARKRRSNNSKRCKPRTTTVVNTPTQATPKPTQATTKPTQATTKPPTSTSKPAPTTTQSSTPNPGGNSGLGKGKASLGWAVNDEAALTHFAQAGKIGALYTWGPWIPNPTKKLGIRPCPMLWGPKQIGQFTSLVKEGYADCVLGFNEPNEPSQSNLDPGQAAELWIQYIQPLKAKGYTLVSPACTNAPSGKTWLQNFFKACNGRCTPDVLAVHFYGTNPQSMISYLEEMHNTFGLNVWPTEFACQNFSGGAQCNMDQVWNFMKTVKTYMDNTSWVDYYFAFGSLYDMGNVNADNQLLGGNGFPTSLGNYYIN